VSLNIVVADDSALMRSIIKRTLEMCGVDAEIREADNGRGALDAVEDGGVDLLIIDINMPEMNGEQVVEAVRANPATSSVPIVVVSTESSDTRRERLTNAGAHFVHKPFTPEDLRQAIQTMTEVQA